MKILHICSSFNQSNLYLELFNELSKLNIEQSVYAPVRDINSKVNFDKLLKNIKYQISNILNKKDRFLFHSKINKITKDTESNFTIKEFNLIHAHYLYSDGAVAYKLYKKYGVRYIITVRNTDINIFYKYRLFLRPLFKSIIANAEKIIFISPAYYNKFIHITRKYKNHIKLKNKSIVISNAINQFWINNGNKNIKILENNMVRFLFIGDLNKNKNIINIIQTLLKYNYDFQWTLDIIGPDKGTLSKIKKDIDSHQNINYHGVVYDKNELQLIYQKNDIFIMPSFKETFGLVYIEALSQGLPVICSENQGIDGLFKDNYICESVNPVSLESIHKGINNLVNRYNQIQQYAYNESLVYSWGIKAKELEKIYSEVIDVNK
jgi:glycosyltransferase involved in cell wall biosynthesis